MSQEYKANLKALEKRDSDSYRLLLWLSSSSARDIMLSRPPGLKALLTAGIDDPTHIRRFRPDELEEMLRNVGFRIIDRRWFDHLFSWFRGKALENLAIRANRLFKRSKKFSYKEVTPIRIRFRITTTALDELDMKLFGHVPSAGIFMTLKKP